MKYATLFEDIGRWTQYLNAAGAIILMIALIIMDLDTLTRITYWVLVLFVWWISYIQTSLMRGLASYFQMKAAAHLENS